MKFVLQKPCLQCMIWLKIMVRPPQHIVLVPKGSPNEKSLKKFDARGWTKRSEVYVYSKNHTKWSLKPCLQCMKWLNIMIRPPQPIVLVPKISPSEKFKKIDARGWTKGAEVYFYSLCSEHTTKWSLCFKLILIKVDHYYIFQYYIQKWSKHCFSWISAWSQHT